MTTTPPRDLAFFAVFILLFVGAELVVTYMIAFDPCSESGLPFSERYQSKCWDGE